MTKTVTGRALVDGAVYTPSVDYQDGSGRPDPGPGVYAYESLYKAGDTFQAALNRCPNVITSDGTRPLITLPDGQFQGIDMATIVGGAKSQRSIDVPWWTRGIWGSGPNTIITIKAMSSSRGAEEKAIANGQGNPYAIVYHGNGQSGQGDSIFRNFKILGTEQGHDYNGLVSYNRGNVVFRDLSGGGIAGAGGSPPKETFVVTAHGGKTLDWQDCDFTGLRPGDATIYGAVGATVQNMAQGVVQRINCHDLGAAQFVLYQSFGIKVLDSQFGRVGQSNVKAAFGSANSFNLEQTADCELIRCAFNPPQGVHITHSNGTGSVVTGDGVSHAYTGGKLTITDPTSWTDTQGDGKLYLQSWAGEPGGDSMASKPPVVTRTGADLYAAGKAKWVH